MMVGLGVALYAAEEYDEAVRVFCAAVDLDPSDRRPLQFLGKARKVSPEVAEQVDQRLRDLAERYPQNSAANYYYTFSLWQRGGGQEGRNLDKIEDCCERPKQKHPHGTSLTINWVFCMKAKSDIPMQFARCRRQQGLSRSLRPHIFG